MKKADPYDVQATPFGKKAGDNKFGWLACPTCGRPATHPSEAEWPWPETRIPNEGFFLFRDGLSAREYYISGMCQSCQDSVFHDG